MTTCSVEQLPVGASRHFAPDSIRKRMSGKETQTIDAVAAGVLNRGHLGAVFESKALNKRQPATKEFELSVLFAGRTDRSVLAPSWSCVIEAVSFAIEF